MEKNTTLNLVSGHKLASQVAQFLWSTDGEVAKSWRGTLVLEFRRKAPFKKFKQDV